MGTIVDGQLFKPGGNVPDYFIAMAWGYDLILFTMEEKNRYRQLYLCVKVYSERVVFLPDSVP